MPPSYYDLLGVDTKASNAEVKAAFRARAKELHPDSKPGDKNAKHHAFVEIAEAYDVLKDSARRRQYDAARSVLPQQSSGRRTAASYGSEFDSASSRQSEDAFEAAFKRSWERGGADWQRRAAEGRHSPDSAEHRRQQAEAWEAEKADAQLNKARFERIRQRTKQARAVRQATVLRGAWQTRTGLVWADTFVAAAAVAAGVGVAAFWAPIFASADRASVVNDVENYEEPLPVRKEAVPQHTTFVQPQDARHAAEAGSYADTSNQRQTRISLATIPSAGNFWHTTPAIRTLPK